MSNKTWYKIVAHKAHTEGLIDIYIWAKSGDSSEALGKLFGKYGIRGIRVESPDELRELSESEVIKLEKEIQKKEQKGHISLLWAKSGFYTPDMQHFHPKGKCFNKVVLTVKKDGVVEQVKCYVFAFSSVQKVKRLNPKPRSKSRKCRRRSSYIESTGISEAESKTQRTVIKAFKSNGYEILLVSKPVPIYNQENVLLSASIFNKFRKDGQVSMFEAEKYFFVEPKFYWLINKQINWHRNGAKYRI